jgi:hypothetical protein
MLIGSVSDLINWVFDLDIRQLMIEATKDVHFERLKRLITAFIFTGRCRNPSSCFFRQKTGIVFWDDGLRPGDSIRQSDPTRLHKDPVGMRVVDRHSDP